MCMLPSRKKIPITINTTGPAIERGGRGGRTGASGGGTWVALAIFHLRRWHYISYRSIGSFCPRETSRRRRRIDLTRVMSAALRRQHYSDHDQQHGQRSSKGNYVQVVQQKLCSQRHEDRRSHQSPGAATRDSAR